MANMGERTNVNNLDHADDECRICLESLQVDIRTRTPVKLRCGHLYHLDCIGSAFNERNKMLCPTCKRVEQGNWRFARSSPSQGLNAPSVQPLMGGLPVPVLRGLMLPSAGRQLGRVPNQGFNVPFVQPLMNGPAPPVSRGSLLSSAGRQHRRTPSQDFDISVVRPLVEGLPVADPDDPMLTSVERELGRVLPDPHRSTSSPWSNQSRRGPMTSVERQLGRVLPTPPISTSSARSNVSVSESSLDLTRQQQISRNISRTIAAKEPRQHRTMYGYDIRSSGGEGGSYSSGSGSSSGGASGSYSRGSGSSSGGESGSYSRGSGSSSGGESGRYSRGSGSSSSGESGSYSRGSGSSSGGESGSYSRGSGSSSGGESGSYSRGSGSSSGGEGGSYSADEEEIVWKGLQQLKGR
ncbi:unnamed protein product [Arabidopsis arenosa]|uniref:RING-type domain-containing protein n=1 Tax=Arabidopsis arenosa TaxID=38785 RepID=A0A8S2AXA6_ARAAE|nr:unnamed protein product [Arabidopsis arenosa]